MAGLTKAAPIQADNTNTATGAEPGANSSEGNSNATAHGQADLASLLFGGGAQEGEDASSEGGEQDPEGGAGAPGEGGVPEGGADDDDADGSGEDEGNAGGGEGEGDNTDGEGSGGGTVFCTFDGQDYTEEQVTTALKDSDIFRRFGESVKPVIADITSYGQVAESLKVAATTETDKMITELTGLLNSGKLDSQQHQQAYVQLMQAQERKRVLDQAVESEQAQRKQAIQQLRTQNARKVGVDLLRAGWTQAQLGEVEEFSKTVFTAEAFADALSPELMGMLRDAMAFRKSQAETEKKLRAMGKKAVKVNNNKPAKPAAAQQEKDLGALLFGG